MDECWAAFPPPRLFSRRLFVCSSLFVGDQGRGGNFELDDTTTCLM
jgi:hypothetical protein